MKEIIYAPTLHPALAPRGLPAGLLFLCPWDGTGRPPGAFTPEGLPFTGREARAVLEELLAMGASFGKGGDLKLMAGQGWLEREEQRKEKLRAEQDDLKKFAESGEAPGGNKWSRAAAQEGLSDASQSEQWKNAQKALLLAWEHEECLIAMRELEGKIADGEGRLSAALGEPGKAAAGPGALPPERPEYSWRIVLDAMSAFLPDDAAIFTAYGPMIDELRGLGLLEPLPGNMVEDFPSWPEELVASLLTASLPLWRILGYSALPGDRPWLGAVRALFVAPRLEQQG